MGEYLGDEWSSAGNTFGEERRRYNFWILFKLFHLTLFFIRGNFNQFPII